MNRLAFGSVVLLLAFAWTAWGEGGQAFPDISHEDLLAAVRAGTVTLLDCNGTASFEKGHIPGALDFQAVKNDLASRLPKDKAALVVAYCGNEHCGAYRAGAQAAADLGYTNVKHYAPGIAGWKKASGPLETAQKAAEPAAQNPKGCCPE